MTIYRSGVYEIRNIVNDHRYIGSSINIAHRLWRHKRDLNHYQHDNIHLQNAWSVYGESSFVFLPLFYCDKEMTLFYEQLCLSGMLPKYNIAENAIAPSRGLRFSDEHKRKLSESNKGKHHEWVGRSHTEETKLRMSESAKRRIRGPMSSEQKRKLSKSLKGRPKSAEWRQKLSEAAKRRWARELGKV